MAGARYAIYYAPHPGSSLWHFGSGVLGYDASIGSDVPLIIPNGMAELGWRTAVADPRRYGFHATLKAPFHLAPGFVPDNLMQATESLASVLATFRLGLLCVERIGAYLALVPADPPGVLATAAQCIVETLDGFRAPLTDAERERRKPHSLTPRQRELLDRFGYPYVAEEFRFHMTLAGPFQDQGQQRVALAGLESGFSTMTGDASCDLDRICIFEQPDPSAHFRIMAAWPLRQPRLGAVAAQ